MASACGSRYWPILWASRRLLCAATSMCEAETLSLDSAAVLLGMGGAVREEAVSLQALLSAVLGRAVVARVHEDDMQCIQAVGRGYGGV